MSATSTTSTRPSYATVLRIPYARRTFATALLGRLAYGIVPLSVMLAVTRASGSYAVAGAARALFGATVVLLAPARAALIDRYGPCRSLVLAGHLPVAVCFALTGSATLFTAVGVTRGAGAARVVCPARPSGPGPHFQPVRRLRTRPVQGRKRGSGAQPSETGWDG